MEFLAGYALGMMVVIVAFIANQEPVTQKDIEQAQAACFENKGLYKIEGSEFHCANGAIFKAGAK